MDAKLRIKMGPVEVEYEGSDEFLRKELPDLLKAVLELHASAGDTSSQEEEVVSPKSRTTTKAKNLSASTIAAKIGAKSGSELALAAAASLVMNDGKDSFSRSDLLKAMQSAKAYYKASYSSNLSNYLSTLVKSQDLLDHGSDNFGLSASKLEELEKKLG